jgi:hypothetical protein
MNWLKSIDWNNPIPRALAALVFLSILAVLFSWKHCGTAEDERPRTVQRPVLFDHDHFRSARGLLSCRNAALAKLHEVVDKACQLDGLKKQEAESWLKVLLSPSERQESALKELNKLITKGKK